MPASSTPKRASAYRSTSRFLVTGASGNLGGCVLHHLLDSLHIDASRIVAGSRHPEDLQELRNRGVTTRFLDFTDAASVAIAARDVDRVLLISMPNEVERFKAQRNAVQALVVAGVRHILYTSMLNADHATALVAVDHGDTEASIRKSGVAGYTFLRNSMFFDNYSVWVAGTSHRSGEWYCAAKQGKLAGIARDDAALASAIALAFGSDASRTINLSATEAITMEKFVGNVGRSIRKPIRAVAVSEDDLVDGLIEATGVCDRDARMFASIDTFIADGCAVAQGADFKRLTGLEPLTHKQWTEINKAVLLSVV